MPVAMIDLNISYPMIDLNVPYVPDGGDQIASHDTASDFASSVRETGYRDDPIVIEQNGSIDTDSLKLQDDDEDEHGDAQQGVIFYVEDMSYEGLLELQERIGVVGTGLKKKVISELLKQRKYQSTKMHDVNDSCCVCLDTYSDREVLGKIDCGHEFHYHCIRKWLKIKNSCPICKRTALTP
ncbi:hypothetical protein K7X08_002777 [Anisodus acutangulus]|uniref:RING-type E3 ubiquitin transferase n=1 Tax=Anisodus acutangulus TaxID=402998 RepID=A0A9Q1MCD9_9SOLA|nr:hypothetical protein K7X08_002777 [Anisodus acutangulus]